MTIQVHRIKRKPSRRLYHHPRLILLEDRTLLSFVAPLAYATGPAPNAVAVGDLNGDGIPDLLVANRGTSPSYLDGSVSELLGNGDGSFQPPRTFAAGRGSFSVAVGDFNGDGIQDLAVADLDENRVSVLLGTGDGSFQPRRTFAIGAGTLAVVVGDLNGDGILDLAVTNDAGLDNGRVNVLLGNGDGSFEPARSFAVGGAPLSVAVGDFNGDGIPDLAVANNNSNTVSVLVNNADGSFQPAVNYAVGTSPRSVAVGDFNGDGIPDLAIANGGFNAAVSVLLGNGDGSFRNPVSFPVRVAPAAVTVGDFNSDGILDLAAARSILLGNGDGSFQAPSEYQAPGSAVAVGDFNGDGILDLTVRNVHTVSALLGNGDGTFQAAPSFAVGSDPGAVAVGDLTGNGVLDIVTASHNDGAVNLLLGNGDGSFQPAISASAGRSPVRVVIGDFNNDGIQDLAVANYVPYMPGSVSVLLGNGDGTFRPARTFAAGSNFDPSSLGIGDFNGDGTPDLAAATDYGNGYGAVNVLLGNGDGSFRPARSFATGSDPQSLAVGDFNGDGTPDLAVGGNVIPYGSGTVSVFLGNGDGTFRFANFFNVGSIPEAMALDDFNGDGIQDLAVANAEPNGDGTISVLLGAGDGNFQPARNYAVGVLPLSVALGDFNGDGVLDLAVANASSNTVSVLRGNGDGTFQALPVSYLPGVGPVAVAVGDFNADGWPTWLWSMLTLTTCRS